MFASLPRQLFSKKANNTLEHENRGLSRQGRGVTNRYRLKSSPMQSIQMICIGCGKTKMVDVPLSLPIPNTTHKIIKGSIGPMPGTRLGCLMGSHDWYFEHEVEKC